jgi:hypothetical protein
MQFDISLLCYNLTVSGSHIKSALCHGSTNGVVIDSELNVYLNRLA